MFRFAICDDDEKFAHRFSEIIRKKYMSKIDYREEIVCIIYNSGEELVRSFIGDRIDVVFMDIEVGKDNGFDIARELLKLVDDFGIVYVTNHDYYVTEAFVCRPLGFIRKNKVDADLNRTLYSVDEFISKRRKEFVFYDMQKPVPILLDKIRCIEVYDHNFIVMLEESTLQLRDTLKRVEEDLTNNGFVKVGRNRMVNLRYVKEIIKNKCVMYNDDEFVISEGRITYVKESLIKYKIRY